MRWRLSRATVATRGAKGTQLAKAQKRTPDARVRWGESGDRGCWLAIWLRRCPRPRVRAHGSGANSGRVDEARLYSYTPRLQSAVVVENACVDATMSTAASAWRGRTASRLASQCALRPASFASCRAALWAAHHLSAADTIPYGLLVGRHRYAFPIRWYVHWRASSSPWLLACSHLSGVRSDRPTA